MPFTIRPAQPPDAPAIAHVHVESWRATYPGIVPAAYLDSLDEQIFAQRWQAWLQENAVPILVAEDPSGIFGFVGGGPIREPIEHYDAELYVLYLLSSHQKQGAGRALIHALAAILRQRSHRSMLVWVLEANPAAGFYQHLGAVSVIRKQTEIGGAQLPDLALGWPDLNLLA